MSLGKAVADLAVADFAKRQNFEKKDAGRHAEKEAIARRDAVRRACENSFQFLEPPGRKDKAANAINESGNMALNRLDERTEGLQLRILKRHTRAPGAEHPDTLLSMANLAATYRGLNRLHEAEELEVQALEKHKKVLGAEHPDTLVSMTNLAATYHGLNRLHEAEELGVQTLEKYKKVLGAEHSHTLVSMANLAATYRGLNRLHEAEELEVHVFEKRKKALGAEHPDTLVSMTNLAVTYHGLNRLHQAEELGAQVLETRKKILGTEHPDTLLSMANLAATYRGLNRLHEAEELEVQVLEKRKKALGVEHPHTLVSMANLAATYRGLNRLHEAEELEVQVLVRRKEVLGAEHPDTLLSMASLAATYHGLNRLHQAEELGAQVLKKRKKILGAEHPDTLLSMANLAATYRSLNRLHEAEELEVQTLEKHQKTLGAEHPHTLVSMANLAATYRGLNRLHEAEELEVQVLEKRSRLLGPEHPDTLLSSANLAADIRGLNRLHEVEESKVQVYERHEAGSVDSELQDPMGHISEEIESKISRFSKDLYTAVFRVHCNLYKYITEELETEESLANLLTVSGTANKAYATTCAEYVSMVWPETGLWMLKTVQKIVINRERICFYEIGTGDENVILEATSAADNFMMIRVSGSQSTLISIGQQLAWLAAISRAPEHDELTYSHVHLRSLETGDFKITVSGDRPSCKGDDICWHPLFARTVIAYGFPVPPRSAEMGIEIPFNIMLRLARISYAVTYDDGLVLCGYSTLLFPSASYPPQSESMLQSHSVQWHLVTSTNDHQRISAGVELAQYDHLWVKIKDEKLLQNARTFLGHYRVSCVHLGTENSGFSDISDSSLADDKPNPAISVRSGNIGTSGLGILGANVNVEVVLPRGLVRLCKIDYYNDILRTAKNMPIMLYDANKQQAWLVSTLSIILHMAHAWVALHAPDIQLPYAEPNWNGGQAAWDIIAKSSRLELQRSLEDDTPYFLKDLVKRLWEHLISSFDSTVLDTRRNRGMMETGRPKLRGWEYMDIIEPPPRSRMKEQVLDSKGCGWDILTEDVLVLVCNGLGEVIKPAQPKSLCPEVYPVQRGRNYLTASVACLSHLSQKCGMGSTCSKLAGHVFWPPPSPNLFDDCVHGNEEPCHKTLQQLINKEGHESKTVIPAEGAVLFGCKVNKLKKKAPQPIAEKLSKLSGSVFGSSKPGITVNGTEHSSDYCSQPLAHTEITASSSQAVENGNLSEFSSLALVNAQCIETSDQEIMHQKTPLSLGAETKDEPIHQSSSHFWRRALHR